MDLFDLSSYFSSYMPIKALSNPFIKSAVYVYAAKHLDSKRIKSGNRELLDAAGRHRDEEC